MVTGYLAQKIKKIKDETQHHYRRKQKKIHQNQDAFLSDGHNKAQCVNLLDQYLKNSGKFFVTCKEDADTQIVFQAIQLSYAKKVVTVVADDTDVFILFWYTVESR